MPRLIPRITRLRFVAPALALAGAAALGGCVAYPDPYAAYGGYYGAPYGYSYPAYQPAPVFGFNFGGGDRDDYWRWHHRDWR